MLPAMQMDQQFNFNVSFDLKDQNTLQLDEQDQFPEDVLIKQEGILCYSTRGSHKHNYDQFDFFLNDDITLAALYDGHGGPTVSLYLKQNLLKNIINHNNFSVSPEQSIVQCIQNIQNEVLQRFQQNCGSTILIVLWSKNQILVVSVGDGLCFGYEKQLKQQHQQVSNSQQGSIPTQKLRKKQLNNVHNLQNEKQRNRVRSAGGKIFKQKNSYRVAGQLNLSRAIGDKKYKKWISAKPQINKFNSKFEQIVLGTDGFSQILQNSHTTNNILSVVQSLPYLKDNSTVIIIQNPNRISSGL